VVNVVRICWATLQSLGVISHIVLNEGPLKKRKIHLSSSGWIKKAQRESERKNKRQSSRVYIPAKEKR